MPYKLALICVFLPLISVHLTLSIGIIAQNLEACIPYWSECHSISATGRQYPEFFIFKALMIPTAIFMMAYWLVLHIWVTQLTDQAPLFVTVMGITACVALIIYTVTLGAVGEPYALARRLGVVFYFSFTSFGHLFLLKHLDKIDTETLGIVKQQNRLLISCLALIFTAILSALIGFIWEDTWDRWENAYEWWFSLLMISLFYHVGLMWKRCHFTLFFKIAGKHT